MLDDLAALLPAAEQQLALSAALEAERGPVVAAPQAGDQGKAFAILKTQ